MDGEGPDDLESYFEQNLLQDTQRVTELDPNNSADKMDHVLKQLNQITTTEGIKFEDPEDEEFFHFEKNLERDIN